ncbi:MAG TPA: hypothetical protein VG817_10635 [Gemmatimonadales bacterium]|nr:hypothetical protein [Gemmatimonadales bacterium]
MKAAFVGLLLLAGPPLQAQGDRWQRQIDAALVRATTMATGRGYLSTGQRLTGALFLDESEYRTFTLAPGKDYLLVAVCDADCRILNLVLSNPNGDEIAYDRQEGNAPFVQATAARGGEYRLKVIMRGCRRSPCRYGVALYRNS